MKNAEYQGNLSCPQRDSAEHEGYAGAQSVGDQEGKEQGGADLLEKILSRENLNRAYKRVKANKGAPGIDGMTVEDALPWLREHREELLETIRQGKYKPQPVRRKEIPKPDGGVRKLGIPTVVDRIIQQAIAQQLTPIRGRLGYFGIASMKTTMQEWDGWLRRRFRCYIWKQWKNPRTRVKNLMKLGMPQWQAYRNGNSQKGYWAVAGSGILSYTITNKRLAAAGSFEILNYYEPLHLCD